MADTDSYEHLYDLPETTSAIGTDVLPIEQSDGTKKIGVQNLLKDATSYADVYTKSQTDTAITDKALTLQNITIPHASVVANTDFLSSTFPYCYDYADSTTTKDTVIPDIVAQDASNQTAYDSYCYGTNLTSAGNVRIYFIAKPTSDIAVTLLRQKGVR